MRNLLSFIFCFIVSVSFVACSKEDSDAGLSQAAKDLGLKEVAVNQDANSPEVCYFVKENGDSITLIGDKDANGCVSNVYLMKYNNSDEKLSTRFDEQMRPISITYNNTVNITFDWQDEETAVIKAFDPETNTYITTTWSPNKEVNNSMSKCFSPTKIHTNGNRNGEMKLEITDRQDTGLFKTRSTAVDDISDQYCLFSVTQCNYPKDASTWIGLFNAKTHKFIENLDYYKKASTGVYYYKIPAGSYPSKATNKELCERIDLGLSALQTGLTWMAGFATVADAVTLVCASTGMGVPPAAILKAITMATVAGSVTLEVFMSANGSQGLMSTFNPDWYYKEYVIADLILSPHVITSTDVIDCEKQQISPESTNIRVNCDIDGDPTIDSFILDPDFPAAGQGYVATATFHCIPVGSTITMSIVGTDGYKNSQTTTINTTSGTANLYVPGAATGVKDICSIVITPPYGESVSMTASLMFGF
jgi:hypothetical protein